MLERRFLSRLTGRLPGNPRFLREPILRGLLASFIAIAALACGAGNDDTLATRGSTHPPGTGGGAGTGSGSGGEAAGGGAGSDGSGGGDPGFTTAEGGTVSDAAGLGDGCASSSYSGEQMPLDMFIMYDQSGSMDDEVAGNITKWTAIKDALVQFVSDPVSDGIGVGMQYFPLNRGSCNAPDYGVAEIPIEPLPAVRPKIVNSLDSHTGPGGTTNGGGGGTPTSAALQGAVDYATAWAAAHTDRKVILVLATDGDPNGCDEDIGHIAGIAATGLANAPPVPTFVIGVGDSLTSLNAIAAGGGTSTALIVDTTTNPGQQFLDAMNKIRGTALSCDFLIPTPNGGGQVDYGQVNVGLTPRGGSQRLLGNAADQAACDPTLGGWYYDSVASPTKIRLCPATCTDVTGPTGGAIDIVLGCQTIRIIPR